MSVAQLINAPPTHQLGLVVLWAKQSQWSSAGAGAPPIIHNLGQKSASVMWVTEQLCIYHLTDICPQPAAWQKNPTPLGLPLALHMPHKAQQAVIRRVPCVVLAPVHVSPPHCNHWQWDWACSWQSVLACMGLFTTEALFRGPHLFCFHLTKENRKINAPVTVIPK